VAGELVAGLRVVFAAFTEDVGANVQGAALLFCLTAIIAGKDKTEVQQKRYRYTDKERDDNSGLYYLNKLLF
jgi:hypothetical protein